MLAKLKKILKIALEYLTAILLLVAYIFGHVFNWKNSPWLILGVVWACVATWDLVRLILAERKLKPAQTRCRSENTRGGDVASPCVFLLPRRAGHGSVTMPLSVRRKSLTGSEETAHVSSDSVSKRVSMPERST